MKRAAVSILFLSLFLGLLALPLHADTNNGGDGGWGENVQVRLLDNYGRLLPGATVNVTFQISKSRGVITSKSKVTDANGHANFFVDNTEFNAVDTNYSFTVNAAYGSAFNSTDFTASCLSQETGSCYQNGVALVPNDALEPRTLTLPVYLTTFLVTDRNGQPLSVPILVDGIYMTHSTAAGIATLPLDSGIHTAQATYNGLSKTQRFNITDDATVDFSLKLYNLGVRVLDDTGAPLPAQVYADAASAVTDGAGWANFYNLSDPKPNVTVYYGRHQKAVPVDLSLDNSTVVLFDAHPPVISNVQAVWKDGHVQVRAVIADKGDYASGLSEGNSSISVYYITADGTQHSLPMYTVGHELYEGLIPVEGGTSEIRYTVQASDAEGNSASSSDTFVVPTAAPVNNTSSDLGGTDLGPLAGPIVVGLVLVLVLAGGYWYYQSKRPPSEGMVDDTGAWVDKTKIEAPVAKSEAAPEVPSSGSAPSAKPPQAPPASPPA